VEAEADERGDPGHERQDEQVADRIGGGASGQHGGAGHRQCPEPVDHSGGEVVGYRHAGLRCAERDGQYPDAGKQVVDVAVHAGAAAPG
jgi:hypothetical protein